MANEILPFGLGAESNVMTQAEYEALAARSGGFSSGVAKSEQLNKVWRQSSFVASVLADFIATQSGNDVLDNGNTATLLASLELAIKKYANSNLPTASTLQQGITKLSSSTNSSSETLAATPKAVKTVSDEGLKITGNLAEIKAAGPAAIAEAQSNLDLAALLGDALQKANNLSEIKDAGPAAVAQTLANLGLGDAAKKGIATNAEMQVGTADKLVSLVGLVSIFGKRTFSENDYIRIPDVPGGLIIQWMKINNFPANAFQTVTLPTAMPHQLLNVVSTMYYGSLSASAEANARVTDFTLTNFRAAAGLSYTTSQTFIAIGY
ncbi:phage tail protein [Yersinia enterocolitica]|uniref:phage tail protein n=1 Tax=Yersinia enterocolitica TaxID=630 RepID=UPI0021E94893|nr:phage tail protein [Yersinia enterocolitica]UYJ99179.1 phage tail protein [Yersinia enterocolitica]